MCRVEVKQKLIDTPGSRGPAVLDDFTASYGYKFNDPAGYQWPVQSTLPTKL
jgi:glucose-6-phosphate 1-dehydrogenase